MKKSSGIFLFVAFLVIGCAEGPLWQAGSMLPWVRNKWEAEEQIAETYFERKRKIDQMVASATDANSQAQAAKQLSDIVQRDPILLLKLHAVESLGKIGGEEAANGLRLAARDPDSRIRIAAIRALTGKPANVSVPQLQEIVGSDTDVDVRLEATKALGEFNDLNATNALSIALTDTNPAIQLRATEALDKITGQDIGPDVATWQSYLSSNRQASSASQTSPNLTR